MTSRPVNAREVIGRNMHIALAFVHLNPGCTKLAVALRLRPDAKTINWQRSSGYATVDRCIRLKLIHATPSSASSPGPLRYFLTLTGAGRSVMLDAAVNALRTRHVD
jgi:hypothetical protein